MTVEEVEGFIEDLLLPPFVVSEQVSMAFSSMVHGYLLAQFLPPVQSTR